MDAPKAVVVKYERKIAAMKKAEKDLQGHDNPVYAAVIAAPGQPLCTDCHTSPAAADHVAAHDMTDVPQASCASCHDGNVVTEHVTNRSRTCGICHDNAAYAAVIDSGKAGNPVVCTDCHTGDTAATIHHAGTQATGGNCTYCHADPRPWSDAPTQAACRECHIDNSGYVITTQATSPSHSFNTNALIQDFGACFACHAPVPYHAKPASQPACNNLNSTTAPQFVQIRCSWTGWLDSRCS